VLLVLLAALGSGRAPYSAADREVFQYSTGATRGALIYDYANRWVEIVGSEETYLFEETGRSNDTIDLIDRSRDVGLRVHAEEGELRLPNSTAWQPWQHGKWIKFDELPSSIRFVPTDRKIRLAYFVPKDREPIAHYEQKIRVVMKVVADVYTDLKTQGYPSAGFTFETNPQGEPIVHLIRADKPAQHYNGAPVFDETKHYQRVAGDIPAEVGSVRRHMLMVFPETYEPGPAPIEWRGSVGRGSHISTDGGVAIMSAWMLRDEFCATSYAEEKKLILDATPISGRTAFGTRRANSPRFEFIEDGFGATAHELGHALGLPHDSRAATDVMGVGFRSLRVNFLPASEKKARLTFSKENARLLGVSRYLVADTDQTDNAPPTAEIAVRASGGRPPSLEVSIKATDDRGLRAAVFYDPQNDTVIGGAELKGKSQFLELKLPVNTGIASGQSLAMMLANSLKTRPKSGSRGVSLVTFVADAGGNIAVITAPVRGGDGASAP